MARLRITVVVCSLLALFAVYPQSAAAHVLKQDNGISAVLHIVPDDNPKARQLTELEVAFGDTRNSFSLRHCDCSVVVKSENTVVSTVALKSAQNDAVWSGKAAVTFPQTGVYDLVITGKPTDASFPAFSLDFLVRVAGNGAAHGNNSLQVGAISLVSLALLVMVGYNTVKLGGRYKQ